MPDLDDFLLPVSIGLIVLICLWLLLKLVSWIFGKSPSVGNYPNWSDYPFVCNGFTDKSIKRRYVCPDGYEPKWNNSEKKMYCTTKCPPGMADNPVALTCYRGFPLCGNLDEEICVQLKCADGYEKQTNHVGEVVCVDPSMSCPAGRDNPEYLGCWKDKMEAAISYAENPIPPITEPVSMEDSY